MQLPGAVHARVRCLQVQGSRPADQYTVFPTHFCTCHAFLYQVVGQDHILVRLSSDAAGCLAAPVVSYPACR